MKITRSEFEREMQSLIDAAKYASCKDTAKRFLTQAENKVYGYDNIPSSLQQEYLKKIRDAERSLGL